MAAVSSFFVPSADRLSIPLGNRVLTFTSTNYALPQPVVLTVVRNREAGDTPAFLPLHSPLPLTLLS